MTLKLFSELRSRLLVILFLAVIPTLILMLLVHAEQQREAIKAVRGNALVLARLAATTQSQAVTNTIQLLNSLKLLQEIQHYKQDPASCERILVGFLKEFPQYAHFSIVDTNGDILCSGESLIQSVNIGDREYFQRALSSGQFTIGEFIIGRVTGKLVLPMAVAITDESGKVGGVAVSGIDLSWLNLQAFVTNLPPNSALTVVDHQGTILARYPDPEKWLGQPFESLPLFSTVQQQTEGTFDSTGIDGIERLYAFTPINYERNNAIYVVLGIPLEIAYAEISTLGIRTALELILTGLLAFSVTWYGTNWLVVRPLDRLATVTEQLATGKMEVRSGPPYPAGRLGQLALAFDKMAESLDKRTSQLIEAEARYRTLIEQVPAAIYLIDLEKNPDVLYISPQIESMLGFSRSEWYTSFKPWLRSIHSEDRTRVMAAFNHSRKTGQSLGIEYRTQHKDGQYVWIRNEAVLFRNSEDKPIKAQGFLININERVQAEEAKRVAELLSNELEQEKQLRELKDRFVSVVSHEFRTPLATILSSASLLEIASDRMTPEKKLWHYQKLQQTVRNMVVLLEQVLTLNKADSGKMAFEPKKVNLEAFCREIIEEVSSIAAGKHEIVLSVHGMCSDATMDENLLRQIINNLLTNAMKYSPEGKPVTMNLSCQNGTMTLCVSDQGIGIPEKDQPRLFEAFHRASNVGTIQGTGLGLAITNRAVVVHGGTMRFESKVGIGTTFTVVLPMEPNA